MYLVCHHPICLHTPDTALCFTCWELCCPWLQLGLGLLCKSHPDISSDTLKMKDSEKSDLGTLPTARGRDENRMQVPNMCFNQETLP